MKEDIIGKTFKSLTVLGLDEEKTKKTKYTYMLCKCTCGNVISVRKTSLSNRKINFCNPKCPNNFYYKIGEIINGLKIIELVYEKRKKYKVKCIKDNYEYIVYEYSLKKLKGCPICANKLCVKGINDVATTHPHFVKFFANPEDATKVTYGSDKKCLIRCPDCGFEKWMVVGELSKRGFFCNQCSDKISYPEKFFLNFIKQLNIKFKTQISHTHFKWLPRNKKYDFYLIDYNCIIETHGIQHYERSFINIGERARTLEEEKENDRIKKELALNNGIKHYIELDCRKSDMEWIKQSIMQSSLPKILKFKEEDIDWFKCNEESLKSYILLSWNYYDKNKDKILIKDMAHFFCVDHHTFRNWLKIGASMGKCTYKSKYDKTYNEDGVGVKFNEKYNRWEASFSVHGKTRCKYFLTKEEAISQRIKWENGDFSECKKLMTTNTSGFTGVYCKDNGWMASIQINKKVKRKYFLTKEEAIQQRLEWENNGFSESEDNDKIIGIFYKKDRDRWVATISINGKSKRKSFKTKEEAIQQRLEWEKEREETYKSIK